MFPIISCWQGNLGTQGRKVRGWVGPPWLWGAGCYLTFLLEDLGPFAFQQSPAQSACGNGFMEGQQA